MTDTRRRYVRSTRRSPAPAALAALVALALAACADAPGPLAPRGAAQLTAQDATRSHEVLTGSIDQYFTFPCLDEPIRFVVSYTWTFDWTTTASGIGSVRSNFIVDRAVSYTVYKGVTYYVTQGRPGHDDNIHYLYGPDGLYIEAGTEPNFESSATGERLRLLFHWQIVVDPNGNTRVTSLTGQCISSPNAGS